MATLEQALISYLKGYAGISGIVGSRVWGFRFPQSSELPCLTIQRISTPREQTHDTAGSSDLAHPRIQFDAWAETNDVAKQITDQLRSALNGKIGSIGSGSYAVTLQSSLVDDEVPEIDPDTEYYRIRSDYIIWYVET